MGVFVEMHGTVHLWHLHFPVCLSDFYILKINSRCLCLMCDFSPFLLCCCSAPRSCLTSQSHGLQHTTRLPCPSPSPGICSSSCPLNQGCHPTISSSVTLFSCPQSFPASGSFWMSQLFASGGQSTGTSTSASVLLCYLSVSANCQYLGNNPVSQFKFLLM